MHYSSIFVYCLIGVVNLSYSGANPAWNAILPLNSNNDLPSTANGYNKISNIENRVSTLDQPDTLHGSTPTANLFQPGPTSAGYSKKFSSVSNIENGFTSNNKDVTVNNDQSTNISKDSNSNDFNSAGTSFVHNKKYNRIDQFNIGYGSTNQNKVVVSDTSSQTENKGSQPSTSSVAENHLKVLHRITEQLQQIVNQLVIQLEEQ